MVLGSTWSGAAPAAARPPRLYGGRAARGPQQFGRRAAAASLRRPSAAELLLAARPPLGGRVITANERRPRRPLCKSKTS